MAGYILEQDGIVQIKDYNNAKSFSSFLPGIAGVNGVPLWCFYVNRAQAVSSFGARDKNHAFLEFFPANKAYREVSDKGFRTFMLVDGKFYEPFSVNANPGRVIQTMRIAPGSNSSMSR